jgi:SARP family transcriptional regulator, regulator of embCAB operon
VLALWRGPAWSDPVDQPAALGDGRGLDELRLSALESRVEARPAAGDGGELIAELEQLVTDHPPRERLIAALMLALYRAGRQTDALDLFQATRSRLVKRARP